MALFLTASILAAALIDLVLLSKAGRFPDLSTTLLLGAILGQVTLATAWLVLARGRFVLRLMLLAGCLVWGSGCLQACTQPGVSQWFCVLGILAGLVVVPLWLWRLNTVCDSIFCPLQDQIERPVRRWQFNVAALFSWMTLVAMLCGAMRWMEFPWQHPGELAAYGLTFLLTAVASLWLGCGQTKLLARLLAVVAAVITSGLLISKLVDHGQAFMVVHATQAATVTLGCIVLSVADASVKSSDNVHDERPMIPARQPSAST